MPRRVPRAVVAWLRSNAAGLTFIGVAYILHCTTFLAGMPPSGFPAHLLEQLAPRWVWGVLWGVIGLSILVVARWRPHTPLAVGLAITMSTLWSISWAVQSVIAYEARYAASAIGWGLVSVLIVWSFSRGQAMEVRMGVSQGGGR